MVACYKERERFFQSHTLFCRKPLEKLSNFIHAPYGAKKGYREPICLVYLL